MSDAIRSKLLAGFVQENGIIRLEDGRMIGRLDESCITYEDIPWKDEQQKIIVLKEKHGDIYLAVEGSLAQTLWIILHNRYEAGYWYTDLNEEELADLKDILSAEEPRNYKRAMNFMRVRQSYEYEGWDTEIVWRPTLKSTVLGG